jgi:hypothetical protein
MRKRFRFGLNHSVHASRNAVSIDFSWRPKACRQWVPAIRVQLPGPERDGSVSNDAPNLLGNYVNKVYFDFAFSAPIDAVATSVQAFTAE